MPIPLHYCCGSFYATPSRLLQLIKMGVNPSQLFVVDEDRRRLGWLAINELSFNPDHVNIICFDNLVDDLNSEFLINHSITYNNIFTICGEKDIYSKFNQISLINKVDSDLIEKSNPIKLPADKIFARLDKDHGGKHAKLLMNHISCDRNDYVILNNYADPNVYKLSLTLSLSVADGDINNFDAVISNSKFKDYSDMYTYTSLSNEYLSSIKYSAHIPEYNNRISQFPEEIISTFRKLSFNLIEAFDIKHGTISTEFFSTPDLTKFFYIETNFRDGDLELACSPNVYNYYRSELIKRNVINE